MAEVISHPVTRQVFDYKDLVERADPERHGPEPAYEFSNGRKFVTREEYRSVADNPTIWDDTLIWDDDQVWED